MLSWWQWLIVAAVPPAIVALYFLKLKRQPLEVPSTYLWRKSMEDLHVNSLWQRLRQNILLLLQLLVLLLIIVALLRPSWRGSERAGQRSIFLIDQSASMSATDVKESRLAHAKQQVRNLIDQMRSGDEAMVIRFSDVARVVHEFTDSRSELREAVASIGTTDRGTNLRGALKLAAGLAHPGRSTLDEDGEGPVAAALPADVYIFSDGKFADVSDFSLGKLTPIFKPIGTPEAGNVGITAFSTRRNESDYARLQAFGRVENYGSEDKRVTVELYRSGTFVDAKAHDIEAGRQQGIVFDLGEVERATFELRISEPDALAIDNHAYAAVDEPRPARVLLVTTGNDPLAWSLNTSKAAALADVEGASPAILPQQHHRDKAAAGGYDLIIYDRCQPAEMPQANTLFIGALPPDPRWHATPPSPPVGEQPAAAENGDKADPARIAAPQIIDVERTHPLMQLVALDDTEIAESLLVDPPRGGTILVESSGGPIVGIGPREGLEDVVVGFEIVGTDEQGNQYVNTNWPLRLSFPTFVLNAVQYLGGQHLGQGADWVRPGGIIALRGPSEAEELIVEDPLGNRHRLKRAGGKQFNFHLTDHVGIYEVFAADQPQGRFAVNLFDSPESNIAPRAENAIQIGYVNVPGQEVSIGMRRELWKPLLFLALLVLLAEWYIYNRRVYL